MKEPSHGTNIFKIHCPQSAPGLHTTSEMNRSIHKRKKYFRSVLT